MSARSTKKKQISIPVPGQLELMQRSSEVAQAAYIRGNASGVHGGTRPRYGTAERRAARREEREARFVREY